MNDEDKGLSPLAQLMTDYSNERIVFCTKSCDGISDPKRNFDALNLAIRTLADIESGRAGSLGAAVALASIVCSVPEFSHLKGNYLMLSNKDTKGKS